MIKGSKYVCLFVLLTLLASSLIGSVATLGAPNNEDDQANDFSDEVPQGLQDWIKAQPKQYAADGTELPVSGTGYFLQEGMTNTASRATGSRTLNACGGGYDQQGGGTHSYLLIATGDASYPNASKRAEIINEFDTIIWPSDTTVFGGSFITKIDICLYYMDGASGLGGYYSGGDNIWVDSADINGWGYEIIAHEFQHMIHDHRDSGEDLWLNEGCSDLAILVAYSGQAVGLQSHIMSFEQYTDNDLTQFDNQIYDYGSAFTYTAYVWEHFGGNATINSLVGNTQHGISSVTSTLSGKGYAETGTEVFYRWTVANIMDDTSFDSAKWGYDDIDIKVQSSAKSSFPISGSGTTNNWAADYYTFTNSGNIQDLKVTFDANSGIYRAYLGAVGRTAAGVESKVVQISLDGSQQGSATIADFGTFGNYTKVNLIVASASSGGSYSWDAELLDKVPPITDMQVSPPVPNTLDGWYTVQPSITLTNNEPGSIYYHWDNGVDQLYTTMFKVPEGEHTLHFHSMDIANNIEFEHSVPIKVDSVSPITTLSIDPATPDGRGAWYVTVPTITMASSEAGNIVVAWDSNASANYTVPFKSLEGAHKLKYYSVDLRGNKEAMRTIDIRVDSAVPLTVAEITPQEPTGKDNWYTTIPTVKLTTDSGAKTYYWWDGGAETEYLGDLIAVDGAHALHYYSADDAGNTEETKTFELKVDTGLPESDWVIEPAHPDGQKGWYITKPTVTLESTVDFTASIYYKFDDDDYAIYEGDFKVLEGTHTLTWYAIDPAGNTESEHTQELMVDTVTPVTTLTVTPDLPANGWYVKTPSVAFNVSEKDATILCHWDYDAQVELRGALIIPEGRHVLYYRATDEAGNTEMEKSKEFKVDTQPPTAIFTGPVSPEEGSAATYDGTTSKDTNGIVSYFFSFGDGKDSGWISSPTTSHTFKSSGTYTVSLKVKDKAGLESQPQTMSVKVKKKPIGGGIFTPGDDDGTSAVPWYKRSYTLAGTAFPCLFLLLMFIIFIGVLAAAGVAVSRRRKRIAREKALAEAEPVERVTIAETDYDDGWRLRKEAEPSYGNEPTLRSTEPYEFGYPSYVAMDDEVEAVQMSEPLDQGRIEGPTDTHDTYEKSPAPKPGPVKAAPATKPVAATAPAAVAKPRPAQVKPGPVTAPAAPTKAKPAAPAATKAPVPKETVPKETKPATPATQPKKPGEVDLDSEISDLLNRLQ